MMKKFLIVLALLIIPYNLRADVHIPLSRGYMDIKRRNLSDSEDDVVDKQMKENIYGFYKNHPELQAALSRYDSKNFKHPLEEKMEKCHFGKPLLGSDGNCYACDEDLRSSGIHINMFPETAKLRCSEYIFYLISGKNDISSENLYLGKCPSDKPLFTGTECLSCDVNGTIKNYPPAYCQKKSSKLKYSECQYLCANRKQEQPSTDFYINTPDCSQRPWKNITPIPFEGKCVSCFENKGFPVSKDDKKYYQIACPNRIIKIRHDFGEFEWMHSQTEYSVLPCYQIGYDYDIYGVCGPKKHEIIYDGGYSWE